MCMSESKVAGTTAGRMRCFYQEKSWTVGVHPGRADSMSHEACATILWLTHKVKVRERKARNQNKTYTHTDLILD